MLNYSRFNIQKLNEIFIRSRPFPHVIIDNIFEKEVFELLSSELEEFYKKNKNKGTHWNTVAEKGKWGSTGVSLSPALSDLNQLFKSATFRDFIGGITGFKNLSVTENINGVGFSFFHSMKPGSFLAPHTDHSRDLNKGPYHVANIILYMAKEWDPNWGGGTTLFTPQIKLASVIEYRPNRALIFMHSPFSIHGTQAVSPNAGGQRYSIYYDFYSNEVSPYAHLTLDKKITLNDSPHRFYLQHFYEYLLPKNKRYIKAHLSHIKNYFKYKFIGKL